MADARFRMFFDDRGATEEELARIEEIEVEQEMDSIWEARVRMAMCLDERGAWRHRPDEFAQPFSRVRVEVDVGTGTFTPLIDGPVAQFLSALDSQPGRSTVTLVVRDDSVFLHRDEDHEPPFENKRDSEVAEIVFGRFSQIGATRIDPTATVNPLAVRRGTVMQFLRDLARANPRYHAYVLPGDAPGASVGCFLKDPEDPADLPPLTLIGAGRNLVEATIEEESDGPERTRGRTLRIGDQSVVSFESSGQDTALMRDLPAVSDDVSALRQLPPEDNDREDPAPRAGAQSGNASYAFRLASRVVPGCYGAVLSPYRKVLIKAGETPYSGEYLLTRTTHRITPSLYTQVLEAKSDSRTDVPAAPVAEAAGGGLSVSFSGSVGIL